MSRVVLTRLVAILFGLVVFCGMAELVCRLVFSLVVAYDVEMWRYAREVKTSGLTPGLRFEHRPGASAHLMAVDVIINRDGLRNRETPRQKPPGRLRVAVVGDSVTFGWGVPQDETYPQRLEELLRQQLSPGRDGALEVINFGVGNYTAADVTAMLEHKALGYAPDLVIYGAFINDAELPDGLLEEPFLLRHSLAAVLIWGRLDRLWRQLGVRENYQEYYLSLYREGGDGRYRVQAELERMTDLCRRAEIPLLVAMLPELHDPQGSLFADIRAFYRSAATEAGAHFVDLQDSLPDNQWRRYWVSADDAHPNAEACDHFAQALAAELQRVTFRQPAQPLLP
jgi:lysophospholipase L1-like esterase